jgi:PmbA protein
MKDILSLADLAVKEALDKGAGQAEAYVTQGTEINIYLENSGIKLAKSQTQDGVGIRVFRDQALGFGSVNLLQEKEIKDAVRGALELAKAAPSDEANELPEPDSLPAVQGLYHASAEAFGIDDALKYAESMVGAARDYDPRVQVESGMFIANVYDRAIRNSNGVRAQEKGSIFEYFVIGSAEQNGEVSAFQFEFGAERNPANIDVKAVARRFAEKAVNSLGARKGESFKGTIILSPGAVSTLLAQVLIASISANNVQKGMSRLTGKLGQQIAAPIFTVEDDATLPGGVDSSTFDREGSPRRKLTSIENGVLKSYLYNRYCAKKDGTVSTGHASGSPRSVPGIDNTNFMIHPGTTPKNDLIAEVKKGVLVTRYSGHPNPFSGEFSGVVKGGFLIEDGKLSRPIIETLISGNVFDLLPNISGLSKETKRVMSVVSPHIRIEDVSVTSG